MTTANPRARRPLPLLNPEQIAGLKPELAEVIEYRKSGLKDYGPPHTNWADVIKAWDEDEFARDPTRLTVVCASAGFDGSQLKGMLAERFGIGHSTLELECHPCDDPLVDPHRSSEHA